MTYTTEKPTSPGWYWCQNDDPERTHGIWEAVVRVEQTDTGLFCTWLMSPVKAGRLHESEWDKKTLWCGPLTPPTVASTVATPRSADPNGPRFQLYRDRLGVGEIVRAVNWYRNGDHPFDDVFRPFEDTDIVPTEPREGKFVRYYRHPNVSGFNACAKCAEMMHKHGWIDLGGKGSIKVCPGDYVVHLPVGILVAGPEEFDARFVRVSNPPPPKLP